MSAQNDHEQSRKFADKSAAIGNGNFEKGNAAVQQSLSATVDNIRDFNVKMLDAARANTEAVFDFARQLASAKEPGELAGLWTSHARKQFEMLSQQSKELTAFGQKIAGESATNLNQAFKKVS